MAAEVDATPAAAAMAEDMGIGLEDVEGSGKDGRITVDDVRSLADKLLDPTPQLTPAGRKIWDEVREYLEDHGIWNDVHAPLLERYVRNLVRANWARERAEKRPTVKGSTKQTVANPLFAVARNSELDAHKYAEALLITPKAMREHLQDGEDPDDDELGF